MRALIKRDADKWLERFFSLRNWMFGWDDQLLLEKNPIWGKLTGQNFQVYDDKDKFSIKADLPGYTRSDIKVQTKKGIISVEAKKELKKEENKNGYYRYENSFRSFQRCFALPKTTDVKTLKTSLKDGKLKIDLDKKPGK